PNTTSSRPLIRPSKRPHAVWKKVLSVRPCRRACSLSAVLSRLLSESVICSAATGARARSGGAKWVASSTPAKACCQAASAPPRAPPRHPPPPQPRQITGVGRHSPQPPPIPLVLIEREQLPHQHRQRPATHQQMMGGEHQPMPIRRKADQRKAHQRRTAQIK